MSLHLYPVPQHVVLSDWATAALGGNPSGAGGRSMQDPASELPRIHIPRTPVNKALGEESDVFPHRLPVGTPKPPAQVVLATRA
jgi:hypothetical protein